ncbi:MAG: hypothetical protein ACO2O4_01560 [Minisyncoccia bacterium]|jgi:hypothetical protein
MNLIFLIILELLSKFLIGKHFFLLLPFLTIFFLNNNKYFIPLLIIFSFLNDLFLILPLGFTGFVICSFFLFLWFLGHFVNINTGWNILVIHTLLIFVLLSAIFYFLKINLFAFVLYVFMMNFLYSMMVLIFYKIIY